MRVARTLTLDSTVIVDGPRSGLRPGRGRLPRDRLGDVRLRRPRLVRRPQAACGARARAGRRGGRGRRRRAERGARRRRRDPPPRCLRRRAASARPGTRRCARGSALLGWTRAASPSTCGSRPSWSPSCCRSTGSTPSRRPAPSRSPALCARRTGCGCPPGDALLVVGAGASGLLHVAAAVARGVERVLVAELRSEPRSRERGHAERGARRWGAGTPRIARPRRRIGRARAARRRDRHLAPPRRDRRRRRRARARRPAVRLRAAGAGRADRRRRRGGVPARADRHLVVVGRRGRHARRAGAAAGGRGARRTS